MSLVYLASPYSQAHAYIREMRFHQVCKYAAKLMAEGVHVFSPIAHTHPIAAAGGLPTSWDFWQEYDRAILKACSRMIILKLDGWEWSKGIAGEIEIATELGLPIEFVDYTE